MKVRLHRGGFSHQELDELRLALSEAVVRNFTPGEIRTKILENLDRWKGQGCWGPAYDEWSELARGNDDGVLLSTILGRGDDAVRLRQSMPYVGLLSQPEVRQLWEALAAGSARATY